MTTDYDDYDERVRFEVEELRRLAQRYGAKRVYAKDSQSHWEFPEYVCPHCGPNTPPQQGCPEPRAWHGLDHWNQVAAAASYHFVDSYGSPYCLALRADIPNGRTLCGGPVAFHRHWPLVGTPGPNGTCTACRQGWAKAEAK